MKINKRLDQIGAVDLIFVVALVIIVAIGAFTLWRLNNYETHQSNTEINQSKNSNKPEDNQKDANSDLGYTYEIPDGWYDGDSEDVYEYITSYDPNRDTSNFQGSEFHFGKPGDAKIFFTPITREFRNIDEFINNELHIGAEEEVKDVEITDYPLTNGYKAKRVKGVTIDAPVDFIALDTGKGFLSVIVHLNDAGYVEERSNQLKGLINSISVK